MFTIDYESVNGGIYRSRETADTLKAAHRLVRDSLRGLDCYHLAFIADAATGRRVEYGSRGSNRNAGSWRFKPVEPLTREQMSVSLARTHGTGVAYNILLVVDGTGEYQFTRTDDYGPLHWRARRYGDGTYALDKIPARTDRDDVADDAALSRIESSACDR